MDPAQVTNLVTSVGFPIVAAYLLWVFTRSRIESSEKAASERELAIAKTADRREAAAEVREGKLVDRINHLEDSIRVELITTVKAATDAMSEAKDTIAYCAGTMNACTVAMNDMRDESKRAARQRAEGVPNG